MKIAVVHNLPLGGQKRALEAQIKLLSRSHKVDLYTPSDFGYRYLPHFPQSLISIYFSLPEVYRQIAEKVDRGKYDVAYIQPCFLTQAPYVLRYLKTPSVYYCPEPKREFYEHITRVSNFWTYYATLPFRYPLKYIDRDNTRQATRILTNSIYSKNMIKKIYKRDVYVNYLGVDTDLFKPYSNSFTIGGVMASQAQPATPEVFSRPSVLTVGEMSLHKGHDFIIRSLGLIPEEKRPKLIIVGHGGSEKEYLLKLAERNKVKLKLNENVSDRELINIYNKVQVFAYASQKEPFGMVLLEALACGLPIVAVEEGGVKEIIRDNLLGILTKRSLKEFKDAVIKYLKKGQGINRREYVIKNWSWEKSVKELERHLEEVAS